MDERILLNLPVTQNCITSGDFYWNTVTIPKHSTRQPR